MAMARSPDDREASAEDGVEHVVAIMPIERKLDAY